MTFEDFAKKCGCVVVEVEPGWGGKYGWQTKDDPGCTCCGYRTESSAYRGFLRYTFGDAPTRALIKLIKQTEGNQ